MVTAQEARQQQALGVYTLYSVSAKASFDSLLYSRVCNRKPSHSVGSVLTAVCIVAVVMVLWQLSTSIRMLFNTCLDSRRLTMY